MGILSNAARPVATVGHPPGPPVVGRDDELARVAAFVDAIGGGPAALVIEGDAGIGKTTVLQAALGAACARGYRVLVSRPAEAEAGLAYAGLADLMAPVDDAALDALPDPQRQALEVALLRAEPAGRAPEPRAIFTAFAGVLQALARDTPVLVAVDDRQWLDAGTRHALDFVARRLVDERIGVLAAARTDAAPAPGREALRLGPLTPGALHRLIKAHAGVNLPRPAVLRAHRETGGNPFYALELIAVLVTAGLPEASEPWPVPDDLRDMLTARLGALPGATIEALLAAAASARPTISGLDTSTLEPAEAAGIVTIDGHGRVRFAHPLFASAIYQSAGPAQRRAVHERLAGEAADIETEARHRALACDGADEDVARLLERAAAGARARGAPDVAADLADRAHALTPADRPQLAWERRVTAADHHFHAGEPQRSRSLLLGVVDEPDEPGAPAPAAGRSPALCLLGEACYRVGLVEDALRFLRRAVDAANGDAACIARAELGYAFVLFYSFGSFAEAAAAARRALAVAERLEDAPLLASALAATATSELMVGNGLDEARLERALAIEDFEQSAPVLRRPSMLAGVGWMLAERFDRARADLRQLCERLAARGEDSDLPDPLVALAMVECFAGDLAAAGAAADRGHELARQAGDESLGALTLAVRALVCAHAGRVDETRAAAADGIAQARRSGWMVAAFWASVALGHLEVALGDHAAALSALEHSIALVERDGVVEPSRRPFLPDAVEALVHLGDLERAERLTGAYEERARALGRRAASVSAARCRALVAAARGEPQAALDGLEDVLRDPGDVPMPLELARTLIVKGRLERRRKHKRQAAESLGRAVGLCERTGATLWAQIARDELARLGRAADPDALTATEAQVARLAATGLTNREIGAAAFISPKTVESNMTRIYRKLGIRSRAELGAWLAGRGHVPG